jgi:hypothetical protein
MIRYEAVVVGASAGGMEALIPFLVNWYLIFGCQWLWPSTSRRIQKIIW